MFSHNFNKVLLLPEAQTGVWTLTVVSGVAAPAFLFASHPPRPPPCTIINVLFRSSRRRSRFPHECIRCRQRTVFNFSAAGFWMQKYLTSNGPRVEVLASDPDQPQKSGSWSHVGSIRTPSKLCVFSGWCLVHINTVQVLFVILYIYFEGCG